MAPYWSGAFRPSAHLKREDGAPWCALLSRNGQAPDLASATHFHRVDFKSLAGELNAAFVGNDVFFAQDNHARLPEFGFGQFDLGEAHDREAIAGFAQVRGGAIEDNLP